MSSHGVDRAVVVADEQDAGAEQNSGVNSRAVMPKNGMSQASSPIAGATLDEALPVAEIARPVGLGLARQSVQRVADLLVERRWAVYSDNPAHRRAKLLQPTPQGRSALHRLTAVQHEWANAVAGVVGEDELRHALVIVRQVIETSRTYRSSRDNG